jgi:hypothetical protein
VKQKGEAEEDFVMFFSRVRQGLFEGNIVLVSEGEGGNRVDLRIAEEQRL